MNWKKREREKNQLEKIICRTLIFQYIVILWGRWIFRSEQHSSCVYTTHTALIYYSAFNSCMQAMEYKMCPCVLMCTYVCVCVTVAYLRVYCVIYACDLNKTSELVVCLYSQLRAWQPTRKTQMSNFFADILLLMHIFLPRSSWRNWVIESTIEGNVIWPFSFLFIAIVVVAK